MTEPQGEQPQIQIAQIAAEMESEPLSRALWERAQYKVMAETFKAQNELLRARVDELERQKNG